MWVTALTCIRLSVWQLHRYDESAQLSQRMLDAWGRPPATGLDGPVEQLHWRQLRVTGRWIPGTTGVVRGTPVAGEPGYQVISTLRLDDGGTLLVDRGWVPTTTPEERFASLDVDTAADLTGLLVPITGDTTLRPSPGPGGLALWPLEMDTLWGVFPRAVGLPFASMAAVTQPPPAALALRVGPRVEREDDRRLGQLPVPGYVLPLPQTHHLSYAAQWLAFSLMAVAVWAWVSRVPTGSDRHE